jgi:hypothetical protein
MTNDPAAKDRPMSLPGIDIRRMGGTRSAWLYHAVVAATGKALCGPRPGMLAAAERG